MSLDSMLVEKIRNNDTTLTSLCLSGNPDFEHYFAESRILPGL
jgi:hypothetical protein